MYARVTTVTVQLDKVAEVTRIFNESIIPAVKAASGNHGIFLLINPATGSGFSMSLWHSEADVQAYVSSSGYREQIAKVSQFFAAPPSLANYEVAAHG